MLEVEWTADEGWSKPAIVPLHDFSIHPAAKVFHYAVEVGIYALWYFFLNEIKQELTLVLNTTVNS